MRGSKPLAGRDVVIHEPGYIMLILCSDTPVGIIIHGLGFLCQVPYGMTKSAGYFSYN